MGCYYKFSEQHKPKIIMLYGSLHNIKSYYSSEIFILVIDCLLKCSPFNNLGRNSLAGRKETRELHLRILCLSIAETMRLQNESE